MRCDLSYPIRLKMVSCPRHSGGNFLRTRWDVSEATDVDDGAEEKKKGIDRQCWVHYLLLNRGNCGAYHTAFQEARSNPEKCKGYIRMDNNQFQYLVEDISQYIQKEDTNKRQCFRLPTWYVWRCYLACGESFIWIPTQNFAKVYIEIVMEVSCAIIKVVGKTVLNTSKNTSKWIRISQKFLERSTRREIYYHGAARQLLFTL